MTIIRTAGFRARPESLHQVEGAVAMFGAAVRASEPGTRLFLPLQDKADPLRFTLLMVFDDDEAEAAHNAADWSKAFGAGLAGHLAGGFSFLEYIEVTADRGADRPQDRGARFETMSTLVVFHAHPDDEAIATGGTMAKAAAAGHRVVLVVATRGECGEVADGYLEPGEELWQRRVEETHAAAAVLGASRVEFLGYVDSGMVDTPTNDDPACFWQADVEEAARRLAAILNEEKADVLTAYDENGVYGHPDHVQVHRVGVRAAELAGTPKVYLNTVDKDFLESSFAETIESGVGVPGDLDPDRPQPGRAPRAHHHHRRRPRLPRRQAQGHGRHGSQISESSFFLAMAPEMFATAFGQEWYILVGAPAGTLETDVFAGL